ncbi:MAG: hypothetical protein RLZZ584_1785 [Pseudomonadota bacterium]
MNDTNPPPGTRWYELDGDNRLVGVDPGWDEFALANHAEQACAAVVLGHRLDEFLRDDSTLMFVDAVLQAARLTGRPRLVNYRCDAPEQSRRFQMRAVPLPGGHVRIEHLSAGQTARPLLPTYRYNPQARRLRCSQCLALREPGGSWLAVDLQRADPRRPEPLEVAYGVCPPCARAGQAALRA